MRDFPANQSYLVTALWSQLHVRNAYSMIFDKKNKMQISVRNIEDLATTIDKY